MSWHRIGNVPPRIALTGVPIQIWCKRRGWTNQPYSGPAFWLNGGFHIPVLVDGDLRFEQIDAQFWTELPAGPSFDERERIT